MPPVDEVGLRFDVREQLRHETALADSRHSDDGYERRRLLLPSALERVDQLVDLTPAPDERRLLGDGLGADARPRLYRLPDSNRLRFPFRCDRVGIGVVDLVRGRTVCRLADEDAVDRSRGLHAGGGIDDIAGSHSLARGRTGSETDQ